MLDRFFDVNVFYNCLCFLAMCGVFVCVCWYGLEFTWRLNVLRELGKYLGTLLVLVRVFVDKSHRRYAVEECAMSPHPHSRDACKNV